VYINSGIYLAAKRKLLGSGRDFSDLVNRLVADWNKA
jgi:hypothetical protein